VTCQSQRRSSQRSTADAVKEALRHWNLACAPSGKPWRRGRYRAESFLTFAPLARSWHCHRPPGVLVESGISFLKPCLAARLRVVAPLQLLRSGWAASSSAGSSHNGTSLLESESAPSPAPSSSPPFVGRPPSPLLPPPPLPAIPKDVLSAGVVQQQTTMNSFLGLFIDF
jgi:hypothetical protein